jgi:hypothetical protein
VTREREFGEARSGPTLIEMKLLLATLASIAVTFAVAGSASAAGGTYVFDGGNAKQQANVRAALAASTFNWNLLPQITIHIAKGTDSFAKPGEIWLDADLLDSGSFAWQTVQHEYGHQIDFALLDAPKRAALQAVLGGSDWCYETPGLSHQAHGCERFADSVATSYRVAPTTATRSLTSSSALTTAAKFRTLLNGLLAAPAAPAVK